MLDRYTYDKKKKIFKIKFVDDEYPETIHIHHIRSFLRNFVWDKAKFNKAYRNFYYYEKAYLFWRIMRQTKLKLFS